MVVYNGIDGVSEEIVIAPSGPGSGQLIVNNAATGTPIVVLDYTTKADRRRRITIGRHPGMTVLKARGRAVEVLAQVEAGADPIADKGAVTTVDLAREGAR